LDQRYKKQEDLNRQSGKLASCSSDVLRRAKDKRINGDFSRLTWGTIPVIGWIVFDSLNFDR
jgi:hypothetical protein